MTISIDQATRVITVQQGDLTFIGGTLYEHDTDQFRLDVAGILDGESHIWLDNWATRNPPVTVAGTTFAQTIEVINGYSIWYDDGPGPYSVRLVGSNNNMFDIQNGILAQNLVQVIPTNSAGLISTDGAGGATADEIWLAQKADYTDPLTMGGNLNIELDYLHNAIQPWEDAIQKVIGVMTVTYETFIVEFPEFDLTTQAIVEAKITEAGLMCDPDAFGIYQPIAVKYLAAHMLAISPDAENMKLTMEDGETYYSNFFKTHIEPRINRRMIVL